ncbi:hypothetical protein Dimus_030942 [Dionaea muscipula]
MSLHWLTLPLPLPPSPAPLYPPLPRNPLPLLHLHLHLHLRHHRKPLTATFVAGGKYYPNPSEDDPPEAAEDASHGVSKFEQIHRQASRARKLQEEDYKNNLSTFLDAIKDEEDAPDTPDSVDTEGGGDDFFEEIDKAIALQRKEFVKQGLLEPNPPKKGGGKAAGVELGETVDGAGELEPEEVIDLEEIDELQGLSVVSVNDDQEEEEEEDDGVVNDEASEVGKPDSIDSSFDAVDLSGFGKDKVRIVEPKFRMALAELLDECKVVPISVYGNLDVEITGIEHDCRMVSAGDLFVCCVGKETDGHMYLSEADKRGAVAVVASEEIEIEETLGCKALVIVEDTNAALPALAASFYRHPTRDMSVIGITGTNGKTTTAYLIKAMYEAMGLRTGMLSSVAYYVHGNNMLEPSEYSSPDAVSVQGLMAKMLHNGTQAVVMETSTSELSLGRCEELDFDIAVFTNLMKEDPSFDGLEGDSRDAYAKLFSKMVDPERHRKIVNIDDPNAPYFVAQGNSNVPVVTFAVENKKADVRPLKFELSLFETMVLVSTPYGILEISSGLLGRHNIYNILAAIAVGVAVGAPLEEIVRGIEEVDAVPGRCELIDEEQTFGVIVDHAQTPNSLSRLLDLMRELKPRRIITVIGCCGEHDRGKRPLMTKIATDKSDVTMLTSDNPGNEDPLDILDDMLSGVGLTMQEYLKHAENDYHPPLKNGHRLFLHDIRLVAVRAAVAMGEEGDMVVVAGKGHNTYQIEGDKREYFDDREECREALQYVDELHQAGIDTSEFPWRLPESH